MTDKPDHTMSSEEIELSLLRKELEYRDKQLNLIKEIAQEIITDLDFNTLINSVAKKAQLLIEAESLVVPIINKQQTHYTYRAACGKNAELIINQTFPINVGMCGWVLSNEKPLFFSKENEWLMDKKTSWEDGMESALLVPLKSRGIIVGGLSGIGKAGCGSFTHQDYELLSLFASHISIAIDNAQIFEELNEEKEYVETTLNAIGDAMITTDDKGRINRMNHVAEKMTGWYEEDAQNQPISEVFKIINSQNRQPVMNPVNKVIETGKIVGLNKHTALISKSGQEYQIADSAAPIRNSMGFILGVILVFHDVTEEYRLEEELRQSELKHRRMIENLGDEYFFYSHNTDGVFDYVSPSITNILGYSQEEFYVNFDQYLTDNPINEKVVAHTRDSIRGLQQPAYDIEIFHKDGSIHHLQVIESPVFDDDINVIAIEGLAHDITKYKQQEIILRRTQKMDALGQLSSGIAHDFNNQLGVIIGYLDMLGKAHEADDKSHRWVETASRATLRCTELTRQLLAFSRNQAIEKTQVNINNNITEMKDIIARSVTPEVEIHYQLDDELWPSLLNEGELQDAILNIIINSRDAMPEGGELKIKTRNIKHSEEKTPSITDIASEEYIEITISDTGIGMDRRTQEQLFEPFYSTKSKGSGTGLGMSMVYGFVQRYGGQIKVTSESGVGTCICIYLPRLKNIPEDNNLHFETDNKLNELPGGTETILIVDDEIDLLELAQQYLEDLGYQTLITESPAEALDVLKQGISVDLIFSDVVMPGGMNGYELINKALEIRPTLKYLLTSGFTSTNGDKEISSRYTKHFLSKPYRHESLAKRIRHVLNIKDET